MMAECAIDEEHGCDPEAGDCGSPLAIPYFVSFLLLGNFVMLNLVVAVILENFSELGKQKSHLVNSNDVADFREVWGNFDPDAHGTIPTASLGDLVRQLKAPLGLAGTLPDARRVARFCLSLHLPDAMRPRAAAAPLSPAAASKASLDGGGGDAIEFRYYQVDQVRVRVRVRVG